MMNTIPITAIPILIIERGMEMIDLTKITPEQANKIECALVMIEDIFKEEIKSWGECACDDSVSEKARRNCKANAEWWTEVHKLIYGKEK